MLGVAARGSRAPRRAPRRCASAACGCRRSRRPACACATWRSRSSAVAGLGGNLEARLAEQPDDALAQEHRVLGDHDASSRSRASRSCCAAAGSRAEARPRAAGGCARARAGRRADGCRGRVPRTPVGAQAVAESEDLAAVPGRPDARRAMDVDSRVALLGDQRLADVDAHPHPNVVVAGPRRARSALAARRRPRRPRRRASEAAKSSSPWASITVPPWSATPRRRNRRTSFRIVA